MTTLALPSPRAVASSVQAGRRTLFDAARLLAAYAIVWLHTPGSPALMPSTALGRFAVPFFTAAAVFLVCESVARGRKRGVLEYAKNRFTRLYLPFLAWSAVYLAFKLAKSMLTPDMANEFPGLGVLVSGGFFHLWFLPFVLVATLATFVVVRRVIGNAKAEARLAVATAGIGTAIAVAPLPGALLALGPVAEYWWMALPAAFWGIAIAIMYRHGGCRWIEKTQATFAGAAVALLATGWTWQAGRSLFAENLAGIAFLIFALGSFEGPWVRRAAKFGPLAYGIYLSHLLFIKVCEACATRLQWTESMALDLATFALAAGLSTALAWSLSKCRHTRWLVA